MMLYMRIVDSETDQRLTEDIEVTGEHMLMRFVADYLTEGNRVELFLKE